VVIQLTIVTAEFMTYEDPYKYSHQCNGRDQAGFYDYGEADTLTPCQADDALIKIILSADDAVGHGYESTYVQDEYLDVVGQQARTYAINEVIGTYGCAGADNVWPQCPFIAGAFKEHWIYRCLQAHL
jgi:hypothetical protein